MKAQRYTWFLASIIGLATMICGPATYAAPQDVRRGPIGDEPRWREDFNEAVLPPGAQYQKYETLSFEVKKTLGDATANYQLKHCFNYDDRGRTEYVFIVNNGDRQLAIFLDTKGKNHIERNATRIGECPASMDRMPYAPKVALGSALGASKLVKLVQKTTAGDRVSITVYHAHASDGRVIGITDDGKVFAAKDTVSEPVKEHWVELGSKTVDANIERTTIEVGRRDGWFTHLLFKVEDGDMIVEKVRVVRGDGEVWDTEFHAAFKEGSRSASIDLQGAHTVGRVEFIARSEHRRDLGKVVLYGKAAP